MATSFEQAPRSVGHRLDARLARAAVILVIEDLNIRVLAAQTGELLRSLTLNPDRGYQPQPK